MAIYDYDLYQQYNSSQPSSSSSQPSNGSADSVQSDNVLLKLWSTIHRLEDELKYEKERSEKLTEQVRSLSDNLQLSASLVEGQLQSSSVKTPSVKDININNEIDTNGMRPEDQKAALDALSTIADVDKPFPTHGVPLWHVLHALSGVEEDRVFTVRRIQKLGFDSALKLREYFSMWGEVSNLLILHRQAKASSVSDGEGSNSAVRVRPPSVGFVVMEDPAVVRRILAQPKHVICGHTCDVQEFEHKHKLLLPPPGLGAEPTTVLTTPGEHSKKDLQPLSSVNCIESGDPFGVWDGGVDMFSLPGYGTTASFDFPEYGYPQQTLDNRLSIF
ncbi:acyl-protein thioesterase [Perkinsus olseni]|uniref:Acyl-protein thioesterase n=1 Tax=Perkinsus olseni TaxID=32597 RepID=A0A7J6MB22_PEROL|nr:acyl-protein thioesterase [Perkinsus olseni]KAF4673826.1 acyl-protein thioesterase [Perkinsus olseni]